DRLRRELQLVDAVDVVADGDGAEQQGEVEDVAALVLREVRVLVRRVRTREVDHLIGEVLAPLARSAAAVVDGDVRVRRLEIDDGRLLEGLLEGGAAAVERDGAARRGGGASAPCAPGARALASSLVTSVGERGGDGDGGDPEVLHGVTFRSFRGWPWT